MKMIILYLAIIGIIALIAIVSWYAEKEEPCPYLERCEKKINYGQYLVYCRGVIGREYSSCPAYSDKDKLRPFDWKLFERRK